MTKYSPATIVVAEGLSMRKQGKFYHYYYRLSGKTYRKSTRTGDARKAKQIAKQAFTKRQYEIDQGIIAETVSFNSLCKKFLKTINGKPQHTFYEGTIRNHIKPFFVKFSDVSKIKPAHIDDYLGYRVDKVEHVANSTLNKERTVLNKLFEYAKKHEYLQAELKLERVKQEIIARPHFDEDQYNLVLKVSKKRIHEFQPANLKGQKKGLTKTSLWSRQLIHDLIVFVVDTGLRPCELKSIQWSQIDMKNRCVKLRKAGKMKSSRRLYIRTVQGLRALERIKKRRLDYLQTHGGQFLKDEYLQSYPNGKKVSSLRKGFNALLDECALSYEEGELSHVFYSLRHTYATYALAGIQGKPVTIRAVSLQIGTSVRMIEAHYGHDTAQDHVASLVN